MGCSCAHRALKHLPSALLGQGHRKYFPLVISKNNILLKFKTSVVMNRKGNFCRGFGTLSFVQVRHLILCGRAVQSPRFLMAVGFTLASPALPQNPSLLLLLILHSHTLSRPQQVFSSQIISSCVTSLSEKPLHGSSEELQLGKQLSGEKKKKKSFLWLPTFQEPGQS